MAHLHAEALVRNIVAFVSPPLAALWGGFTASAILSVLALVFATPPRPAGVRAPRLWRALLAIPLQRGPLGHPLVASALLPPGLTLEPVASAHVAAALTPELITSAFIPAVHGVELIASALPPPAWLELTTGALAPCSRTNFLLSPPLPPASNLVAPRFHFRASTVLRSLRQQQRCASL
jgi:hypothetical protein